MNKRVFYLLFAGNRSDSRAIHQKNLHEYFYEGSMVRAAAEVSSWHTNCIYMLKILAWHLRTISQITIKEMLRIPRALFATAAETFEQDIKRLEILYAKDEIVSALKNTKERISNEVCEMVAKWYQIETFWRKCHASYCDEGNKRSRIFSIVK